MPAKATTATTRVIHRTGKTYLADLTTPVEITERRHPETQAILREAGVGVNARRWIASQKRYATGLTTVLRVEDLTLEDGETPVTITTAQDREILALVDQGWTVAGAWSHVHGECDHQVCPAHEDSQPAEVVVEGNPFSGKALLAGIAADAKRQARLEKTGQALQDAGITPVKVSRPRTGVRVLRTATGWDVEVDGKVHASPETKALAYVVKRTLDAGQACCPNCVR